MRDLQQPPTLLPGGGAPGKLVVVESVYHLPGNQAAQHMAESRYARWLASDRRAHVDEVPDGVGPEWERVQTGRIGMAGMVVIENLEGTDLTAVPTPEQRAEIAARVLEVGFGDGDPAPGVLVPPGETARFQPSCVLSLRCPAGRVKCRVTIFPA